MTGPPALATAPLALVLATAPLGTALATATLGTATAAPAATVAGVLRSWCRVSFPGRPSRIGLEWAGSSSPVMRPCGRLPGSRLDDGPADPLGRTGPAGSGHGPRHAWSRLHRRPASVEALRVRTDLPALGTSATVLLPGLIPGISAYTVKVNTKFPASVPALRGLICLHSAEDGTLLAVMDSAEITAWRTGLAAALATDRLAPRATDTLGVIGAGAQARMVLHGLARLRRYDSVVVCDVSPGHAESFAAEAATLTNASVQVVPAPRQVPAAASTVVTATWAREPLLDRPDVPPGGHITSLGADEPGKLELSPDLLAGAAVFVDDVELNLRMGAVGNAGLGREAVAATLGQVLRGEHPGRTGPEDLTV